MSVKLNMDFSKEILKKAKQKEAQEVDKLINALKDATPVDTGKARDGWQLEDGKIVNHVEHIDELNAGSSKQAPTHFIERTLLAFSEVKPNGVIVTSSN